MVVPSGRQLIMIHVIIGTVVTYACCEIISR